VIKDYQNIDTAFKDYFEKKDTITHKYDFAYELKKNWIEDRLISFNQNLEVSKLNDFLQSLPMNYQIDKTENYVKYIAILRSQFLCLLLQEKRYDESFFHLTAKSRYFYDYDQSSNNYLKDEVKTDLTEISLKKIIDSSFLKEEDYLDSVFLIGCFNFFLQFLFSSDWEHCDGYINVSKKSLSDAKAFYFDLFLEGISETTKLEMHDLITEYFDNHHTKININFGFKKFNDHSMFLEKERDENLFVQIKENLPFTHESIHSDYLSWCPASRGTRDVHLLWDSRESKYLNNAVLIDNMIGASKVLGMYSDFISEEQKDFLRYQKLYNGETTLINLTESLYEDVPNLADIKWHEKF
jgi:hypothetical protein